MAYSLFRLYSEKQSDEHRFERLRSEMIPKIRSIPGFQRFAAIQTNDGRYGGFQVYETRDGVDQAVKMLSEWRQSIGMNDAPVLELRGETGLSIVVNPNYDTGYGTVRIYRTQASFEAVNAAIEQDGGEAIRNLPGLLRLTTVKLDDGRIATFTACETEAAARAMIEKARELRGKPNSELHKVLPSEPEVIMAEIKLTVSKVSELAHT